MNWISPVDSRLRGYTQIGMDFLGRRWGVTRKQVTRNASVVMVVSGMMVFWDVMLKSVGAGISGLIITTLINLWWALAVNVRGYGVLSQNEDWGQYTNWEEWKWLRYLSIWILPVNVTVAVTSAAVGDFGEIPQVLRDAMLLVMLYSITVGAPPPKRKKEAKVPVTSHVGAH
jgi:hypothetical protein